MNDYLDRLDAAWERGDITDEERDALADDFIQSENEAADERLRGY